MDTYLQRLLITNPLVEPAARAAIQALNLPLGSRGLDAGCGVGLQAWLLAEAVGPAGHVTGLDLSSEFLDYGRDLVEKAGLSNRISFKQGDVRELPFDGDFFDWAWSANCVGYAPLEPLPLVKEMARVVKPGGRVVILAWSSEKLLPGYPSLEARLSGTTAGIAPFVAGKQPELHFLRALGWFREAGLEALGAHTFVTDAYAPLNDDLRSALVSLFEMRWPGVESELSSEDRAMYRRLCMSASPDFVLDDPDYYAFYTYTMFSGQVVKPSVV
jgi:demethylmenaquinone methyltransferase/2-methoxy-6-polyprenyl-1,4-benzoquinol methylase